MSSIKRNGVHFYIPSFAGGGVERTFIRLANATAMSGRPTRMIVNTETGPLRHLLSSEVEVINLDARRNRSAILKLAHYLRIQRPPSVISALTFNNLGALIARRIASVPTRLVVSERAELSGVLTQYSPMRSMVAISLVRRLYPQANAITAVSAGTADDLCARCALPRQRIAVIPNPPPERSELDAARAAPCPHPWFADGRPVAVAIGRLERQKNYPLLLEALARVRASGADLRLIVLGAGGERPRLEQRVQALGLGSVVAFEGFVLNRLDYLVRATLYVLSSDWEGYPNALFEAVVCGVPAISTDCRGGGAREILGEDVPVPCNDPEALVGAILACLRSKSVNSMRRTPLPLLTTRQIAEIYVKLANGE